MDLTSQVKAELAKYTNPERAKHSIRYFQAQPGGYGEGDQFLGISVPDQQKVARKYYRKISLAEAEELLQSPIHEHRLTALTILNYKFEKATPWNRKKSFSFTCGTFPMSTTGTWWTPLHTKS